MKVSDEFLEYVLDSLAPVGKIQTTKMFGGVLLKVEGKQLGVVFDNELFFKVTDTKLQEKFRGKGSTQFTYTKKTKPEPIIIKNWWSTPEEAMDNTDILVEIAEEVLTQN